MIGLLFVTFLITLIVGAVLASSGDELHSLWLRVVDAVHHSPAEKYYKQIRETQLD